MEEIGGEDKGDMLVTEGVGDRLQPHVKGASRVGTEARRGERLGGFQCLDRELLFSRYLDPDGSDCSSRGYGTGGKSSGAITLTVSPGETTEKVWTLVDPLPHGVTQFSWF